jgi:hypothetical protein
VPPALEMSHPNKLMSVTTIYAEPEFEVSDLLFSDI